ncbi:hypothetical protein [Aquimarina algiphila]|uniref:hypothetical protein n=1 Tax=Aquimarina algiphila TaxID=2047982 RepID=UPI00232DF22A|nr:hypothetical protein [Aquimarina algiphila]
MNTKFLSCLFLFSVLFISCSSDDDSGAPDTGSEQEATLITRTDVSFELETSSNTDPKIAYSTSEGKIYKESELNATNIATIDLLSFVNQSFISFDSPDDIEPIITGAKRTKYQYENVTLTVADFDSMVDDSKLKSLTINEENTESISSTTSKDVIILFENEGRKGAMKVKAINSTRLLVDIKVQK